MHRGLKALYVAGVIFIPLILIMYVWAPPPEQPGQMLDPRSPNFPAAVQSLRSTADLLVSVSMGVLGGIGLLMVRLGRSNPLIVFLAATGFMGALMTIFFACQVGFLGAVTLASPRGDLPRLLEMLNNAALSTLVAGLSLASIAVLEAFPDEIAPDEETPPKKT